MSNTQTIGYLTKIMREAAAQLKVLKAAAKANPNGPKARHFPRKIKATIAYRGNKDRRAVGEISIRSVVIKPGTEWKIYQTKRGFAVRELVKVNKPKGPGSGRRPGYKLSPELRAKKAKCLERARAVKALINKDGIINPNEIQIHDKMVEFRRAKLNMAEVAHSN